MALTPPAVGDKATAVFADAAANQLNNGGFITDATSSSTVTLATAVANVASSATVTFTLTETRRVRIVTSCQFSMASGTDGRYRLNSAYNSGVSVVLGSAITVGALFGTCITTVGDICSGFGDGTVVLAAGSYTAYALVQRNSGGGATDTARTSYVAVYDCGTH